MRDGGYANSDMELAISSYIHSDRDAEIIRLRFIHGMTYERIAEWTEEAPNFDHPLSLRQVYRIVAKYRSTIMEAVSRCVG